MPYMTNDGKGLYEFGPFRLDPAQRLLLRDDQPIPLQPKAFETLLVLVRNSEKVVLKNDLLNAVWADTFVEESNLTQNIFVLRKALGDSDGGRRYILTVPGRGYRLTEKARFVPRQDDIVLHSVTSITLEDETKKDGKLPPAAELESSPSPASAKHHWGLILLFVLVGAGAGALLVRAFLPQPMLRVLRSVQLTHFGRAEPFGPVVTDGSRLYFIERIGGSRSLAQVSDLGGEPALISTSLEWIALLDIDRGRSKLLVGAQGPEDDSLNPLWVVPTGGGSGRRLGDVSGVNAVWSPDGQSIAYGREGSLFVAREDGQQPRKLFSAAGFIEYPRWSPDGRRLSFTLSDTTSTRSLWEIAADGSGPHRLNLGWKAPKAGRGDGECCGDWTPDGKFFAFRAARDQVQSFWAIRDNDSRWFHRGYTAPVQLYTSPDRIGLPRFSADGKKIFFVDYQERRELVRYDSVRKTFVPYLGGIPARHLSFSRDGQWVAYKNEADQGLWRSRSDGTEALQLTFPPVGAMHSSWAPDGKRIAFESNGTLYAVPREGGKAEPLLPDDLPAGQPDWSPDGKWLVFTRWTMSDTQGRRPSLYLLDFNKRQVRMIPGSDDFEGAQWSPDGKFVAAADRKDRKLMLFDFARQQWLELADGTPYGWGMRWSSDGRYVYYQHIYAGEEQPIFRVRVSDHKVEQVASSLQILRADVLSYSMTGLTPDGSPLASLIHRNSDIFALELDLP